MYNLCCTQYMKMWIYFGNSKNEYPYNLYTIYIINKYKIYK